jgi:uracil-DNA glycosylase
MPIDFIEHCRGCPYEGASHLDQRLSNCEARPLNIENNDASVLLIFQSPGENEWRSKRPVSSLDEASVAGRFRRAFKKTNTSRANFDITNAVQCYQGKALSRGQEAPRDKKPSEAARKRCSHWLKLDIESHDYARIVVFGSVAKRSVRDLDCFPEAKVTYLLHPSGGLSNEKLFAALVDPDSGSDDQ